LLERLKYLCISSSNLDEFFEIRIAVLKQREKSGMLHTGPDHQTPGEILKTLITVNVARAVAGRLPAASGISV
jgi:polyphosphate kinase